MRSIASPPLLLLISLLTQKLLAADAPTAPATASRARQVVALPGPVANVVVGGNGRYLVAALKDGNQVAVVDVREKKIAKLIPVDDALVLVAAGATKLVIHESTNRRLTRYKLGTWEKELSVESEMFQSLVMGSSSEGPLLASCSNRPTFLALDSLENLQITDSKTHTVGPGSAISASGEIFAIWSANARDRGGVFGKIVDRTLIFNFYDAGLGALIPSPDGTVLYSGTGIYANQVRPRPSGSRRDRVLYVPAATGPYYLTMTLPGKFAKGSDRRPTQSELRAQSDRSPLLNITGVTFPDEAPEGTAAGAVLPVERRTFLLPDAKALVSIPASGAELLIHHFDIAEELAKTDTDYLFVSSLPPLHFKPGAKLSYQLEVQSKQRGKEYRLEIGPSGMTLSPEGLLTWTPAVDFKDRAVVAVINIRNQSGQEIIQTIKLDDGRPPDVEKYDRKTMVVYSAKPVQPPIPVGPQVPTTPRTPAVTRTTPAVPSTPPVASVTPKTPAVPSTPPVASATPKTPAVPATPPVAPPNPPGSPPTPAVASVTPPVSPPTPPVASATPKTNDLFAPFEKIDDNRWAFITHIPRLVMGVRGRMGGILAGRDLYFLGPDGAVESPPTELAESYPFLGFRGELIVAIGQTTHRLDVLSRSGKVLRTAKLPGQPLNLVMHPTKPISYVSVARESEVIKAGFVVVDEVTGEVSQHERYLGSSLVVDPAGRFLVTSYTLTVQTGQQIVRVPGAPSYSNPYGPNNPYGPGGPTMPGGPRGRYGPQPNPYGGNPYGPPNPYGPGAPRTPDQFYVQKQFESGSAAFVYDLSDPTQPELYSLFPLVAREADQLRISYDGRRLTGVAAKSHENRYIGFDPLAPKKEAKDNTEYYFVALANIRGADVAHHPALPLTVIAENENVHFFNTNDGKQRAGRPVISVPKFEKNILNRAAFSRDGMQVLLLSDNGGGRVFLDRLPLPLTPDEIKQAHDFESQSTSPQTTVRAPLADLTALRGGIPKPMRVSEIATTYSPSVVVVRSGPSTGTGFVVGSTGLVMTCAHCVSPFGTVDVSFQPPGAKEKKTYPATVIKRDPKIDLALLRFKPDGPLPTVILADPLDVNNGEDVTVIANPGLGDQVLDNTVTTGVISNRRRSIEGNDYIQSSAAVNPGSSGGPMFDSQGRVIGVVVLKAGIDGVGFAIPPATIADFLLRATTRDGQHGQLLRSWRDTTGTRSFEGRLVEVKSGAVVLTGAAGGEPKSRAFTIFSPGDQKLLEMLEKVK